MKILVACEESQAVTKELRLLGHEAYSCDLLPTTGDNPEWHLPRHFPGCAAGRGFPHPRPPRSCPVRGQAG